MPRTRSKPATKSIKSIPDAAFDTTASKAQSLPASDPNPPKLFILPKRASQETRIVTLDNPATEAPSKYYFCPEQGFAEFTRIAAPRKACRSWLITADRKNVIKEKEKNYAGAEESVEIGSGYLAKSADLFIATPIDLLFLILPALMPKLGRNVEQHYLELYDHLQALSSSSPHWKALLSRYPSLNDMVEKRLGAICDTVKAGEETMYRLSHAKLLAVLLRKAERMSKQGLPPSMEEKFIRPALEVPVVNIRSEDSSISMVSEAGTPALISEDSTTSTTAQTSSQTVSTDSQISISSLESNSTASTSITIPSERASPTPAPPTTPLDITHLLRLRTALIYLMSSYLPPTLHAPLNALLAATTTTTTTTTTCSPDFTPLDAHLATLAKLRAEAQALRSISDNISRKRGFNEMDEEQLAEREEKKRKKEEEERRRKSEGRGIKALKKVDTSGMMKLSAFFKKKA